MAEEKEVVVKFTGENEIKLTGATAAIADAIKEVAQSLGLEYKFDRSEKAWTITGSRVNEFAAKLHDKVKDKVKVVVDFTTANKVLPTPDRFIRIALALAILQADLVLAALASDKLSNSDLARLRRRIVKVLEEARKLLR